MARRALRAGTRQVRCPTRRMSDRPIRIILDTSAIIAYTRGSLDVGEVIAEIEDEEGGVGVPMLCLVEANHTITDHQRLAVLIGHPATVLLTTNALDWQALA